MKTSIVVCAAFAAILLPMMASEPPNVRCTLTVVTPDGAPVVGAQVGIGGGLSTPDGKYPRNPKGHTDEHGQFSAILASSLGDVSGSARLDGYYESNLVGAALATGGETEITASARGRWEPWERSFKLILKPIKNPVPMYAKRIDAVIPVVGTPVGYDLEKGDWIAPYGKGERIDIEFLVEARYEAYDNYEGRLTLRLPGKGNGILPIEYDTTYRSELKMPYEAPLGGYLAEWSWKNSRTTDKRRGAVSKSVDDTSLHRGFIYRVRSVVDSDGKIVSAYYGKIHGPIYFRSFEQGKSRIKIEYYFNPDGTRNLEFDPKRNLFKNLKTDERVYEP